MINFKNFDFFYDPFPHGIINNFLKPEIYKSLCEEFPSANNLKKLNEKNLNEKKFHKFQLGNTGENKKIFFRYLNRQKTLKEFYRYVNSNFFLDQLLKFLLNNHIDLKINLNNNFIKKIINKLTKNELFIDFEFSSIPVDSGFIAPHTDGGNKILGFVIPIIDNEEIFKIQNIGTKIFKAKSNKYKYNFFNKTTPYEDVELIKEMPYKKNMLSFHVKTFNSLHGVGPLRTDGFNKILLRKSISMFLSKR